MALSRALRLSILHYTSFVKNGINSFWQTRNTSVLFSVTTLRCPYKKTVFWRRKKADNVLFSVSCNTILSKRSACHRCLYVSNEPTNSFPLESSLYKYFARTLFRPQSNVQCTSWLNKLWIRIEMPKVF